MSNDVHLEADFTLNIPHLEADFTENEQPKMQADFKIQTGGSTSFANITGDPYDNEALSDALNQKADTSTVETLSETVENNYTELDGKITDESDARTQADADLQSNIDDVADDLSIETDNRQTADADLQDNIDTVDGKINTHIADKTNPHEVTKTQVGLGNVDNTSDLNKPISTATQTALNGKQDTINDLSTIRSNAANGQSAYTTIGGYGDIVTYNASNFVQKNGDSSTQTISLTSGTGTTALGIKSMATSSYISLSGSSGWLGSYGVSSSKRAVFYNGTGYTLAYTSELPTKTSELTNDSGYITGIDSSDVITALGYTPYDSTNPNGFTSNVGTVISVNNTQPDANGNVTLTIPTVNDGVLTITQNGTSKGTFSANQSTNDTIALTDTTYSNFTGADGTNAGSSGLVPAPSATDNDKYLKGDGTWASVSGGSSTDVQINGTSITNQGVANIVTNSAYDADSNKIATMSDLPESEIFIATYGTTTYTEITTALSQGKAVFCIKGNNYYSYFSAENSSYYFSYGTGGGYIFQVSVSSSNTWGSTSKRLQDASTAVTHTASTVVGSSTVPVYVNSSGFATSTGLSIASSRFDGQWVQSFTTLMESNGTKNGVQISLSSYLPSDSYKYNVKFKFYCFDDDSTYYYHIETDTFNSGSTATGKDASTQVAGGTYSRQNVNIFDLPVGTGRYIKVYGSGADEINIYALGYRRIGTNS